MSTFTLENLPSIKYVDVSSNRLREVIGSSETLLELSVSDNRLTSLPETPNLQCLFAESNFLTSLPELSDLTTLEVSKNRLTSLGRYPRLVRLVASHNQISEIGSYPRVTNIELGFNLLESFVTPPRILHASIHFNPIKRIEITPESLAQIKEIQLPFPAYRQIYKEYYDTYESVSVQVARERLDVYLNRLTPPYSPREVQRMIREISLVKFPNRADGVYRVAIKTYYNHLKAESGTPPSLREIADSPPFQTFLKTLDTFYEKSLLVNMYFNGYRC